MVLSWINRTLSPHISRSTNCFNSTFDLWEDLRERFLKGNIFCFSDFTLELFLHPEIVFFMNKSPLTLLTLIMTVMKPILTHQITSHPFFLILIYFCLAKSLMLLLFQFKLFLHPLIIVHLLFTIPHLLNNMILLYYLSLPHPLNPLISTSLLEPNMPLHI